MLDIGNQGFVRIGDCMAWGTLVTACPTTVGCIRLGVTFSNGKWPGWVLIGSTRTFWTLAQGQDFGLTRGKALESTRLPARTLRKLPSIICRWPIQIRASPGWIFPGPLKANILAVHTTSFPHLMCCFTSPTTPDLPTRLQIFPAYSCQVDILFFRITSCTGMAFAVIIRSADLSRKFLRW